MAEKENNLKDLCKLFFYYEEIKQQHIDDVIANESRFEKVNR